MHDPFQTYATFGPNPYATALNPLLAQQGINPLAGLQQYNPFYGTNPYAAALQGQQQYNPFQTQQGGPWGNPLGNPQPYGALHPQQLQLAQILATNPVISQLIGLAAQGQTHPLMAAILQAQAQAQPQPLQQNPLPGYAGAPFGGSPFGGSPFAQMGQQQPPQTWIGQQGAGFGGARGWAGL